ncbi:hypothetical protein M432DRAFT_627352 [Thermoascus aurantiacus ATCC 26904]
MYSTGEKRRSYIIFRACVFCRWVGVFVILSRLLAVPAMLVILLASAILLALLVFSIWPFWSESSANWPFSGCRGGSLEEFEQSC